MNISITDTLGTPHSSADVCWLSYSLAVQCNVSITDRGQSLPWHLTYSQGEVGVKWNITHLHAERFVHMCFFGWAIPRSQRARGRSVACDLHRDSRGRGLIGTHKAPVIGIEIGLRHLTGLHIEIEVGVGGLCIHVYIYICTDSSWSGYSLAEAHACNSTLDHRERSVLGISHAHADRGRCLEHHTAPCKMCFCCGVRFQRRITCAHAERSR